MSPAEDMPDRPLDLFALLSALTRHRVEHVVVGGVAVQVHGHRRTTKDLDLVPGPSPDNYERLAGALVELEARLAGEAIGSETAVVIGPEQLRLAPIAPPLTTKHGELHLLNEPKGGRDYDGLRARALVLDLDGVEVAIVGLDDLIRMKRASGRPQDLEDITVLTAVERRARDD